MYTLRFSYSICALLSIHAHRYHFLVAFMRARIVLYCFQFLRAYMKTDTKSGKRISCLNSQFITHFRCQSKRQSTMLVQKEKHKPRLSSDLPGCRFKKRCDFKESYRTKTKCRWSGKCNQQIDRFWKTEKHTPIESTAKAAAFK